MNWRRGLFRLWIVGAALFVIAVAFISYDKIKEEFAAIPEPSILAADKNFADQSTAYFNRRGETLLIRAPKDDVRGCNVVPEQRPHLTSHLLALSWL